MPTLAVTHPPCESRVRGTKDYLSTSFMRKSLQKASTCCRIIPLVAERTPTHWHVLNPPLRVSAAICNFEQRQDVRFSILRNRAIIRPGVGPSWLLVFQGSSSLSPPLICSFTSTRRDASATSLSVWQHPCTVASTRAPVRLNSIALSSAGNSNNLAPALIRLLATRLSNTRAPSAAPGGGHESVTEGLIGKGCSVTGGFRSVEGTLEVKGGTVHQNQQSEERQTESRSATGRSCSSSGRGSRKFSIHPESATEAPGDSEKKGNKQDYGREGRGGATTEAAATEEKGGWSTGALPSGIIGRGNEKAESREEEKEREGEGAERSVQLWVAEGSERETLRAGARERVVLKKTKTGRSAAHIQGEASEVALVFAASSKDRQGKKERGSEGHPDSSSSSHKVGVMGKRRRGNSGSGSGSGGGGPSDSMERTYALNICSKNKDLRTALSLFDASLAEGEAGGFTTYQCNVVLYLCALAAAAADAPSSAPEQGRERERGTPHHTDAATAWHGGRQGEQAVSGSGSASGSGVVKSSVSDKAASHRQVDVCASAGETQGHEQGEKRGAFVSRGDSVGEVSCSDAQRRGVSVYEYMCERGGKAAPNEATFTSLARLAAAAGDPHLAFRVVKDMVALAAAQPQPGGHGGHGGGQGTHHDAARGWREASTGAHTRADSGSSSGGGSRGEQGAVSAACAPRLRSYEPALLGFCRVNDVVRVEEVLQHMQAQGVEAGEEQLLAVMAAAGRAREGGAVYRALQRLRRVARGLPAGAIEDVRSWFGSQEAERVGDVMVDERQEGEGVTREERGDVSSSGGNKRYTPALTASARGEEECFDASGGKERDGSEGDDAMAAGEEQEEVKEKEEGGRTEEKTTISRAAIEAVRERNGGGWHGMGWVGQGRWKVEDVQVSEEGVCGGCGELLACIDLDERETEAFIAAVEKLVADRGKARELAVFKDWLERHGPFPAVLDAANIALFKQNYQGGGFSFHQLNSVMKAVSALCPSSPRPPLVIAHNKRTRPSLLAQCEPNAAEVVQRCKQDKCLFETPTGSNDDWYWLYAAVSMRCLLVSNDEMRDHVFATLGNDFFFPKWKERHQVRFDMTTGGPVLRLPPSYSFVIQESWNGSWHFPKKEGVLQMAQCPVHESRTDVQGNEHERVQGKLMGSCQQTNKGLTDVKIEVENDLGQADDGFAAWLCVSRSCSNL